MNHWRTTIRRLNPALLVESADREIFAHKTVISALENHMQTDGCRKIKDAFNHNPDDPDKFSATLHCELVLGAVITRATAPPEGTRRTLDQVRT